MLKRIKRLKQEFQKARKSSIIYDIEPSKAMLNDINRINLEALSHQQLKRMSLDLMNQAKSGVPIDCLIVRAFSLVKEASYRVLGLKPFDVQIIAALAMHYGNLAEMQTGEGKTLAAVFPAYLNALSGKGIHVLTFNDYLAKRDAEWMGPVYSFLGLSAGYINEGMDSAQRKLAYDSDITYVTAKEAGFDYLRSFLCVKADEIVQRPFHYAIVDEADSILIDEARIPLVIAGDMKAFNTITPEVTKAIKNLETDFHYTTDEYRRNVYLTENGIDSVEKMLMCGNLYDEENLKLLNEINNALHAEVLLKRDIDYIVRNGRIELIDEFTGRIADKRHWPDGLQAAIEAKEGLTPQTKGQIICSITIQNFIRLYPKICGMTGTAQQSADEFKAFYGLNVVVIPTNRPCIRVDHDDIVFTHKEAKYRAIVEEVNKVHASGRPILIGTSSVEESEHLAASLKLAGIECQVLNARNDALEAEIISNAGAVGVITVSTNMAGRGTDIKLGGEDGHDHDRVVSLGGLYVIGTNRHESHRIDNQLKGRAGRQGDPGSTRFFISLEDDLMVRYRLHDLIPKKYLPEAMDDAIANPVPGKKIALAQRIIEGQNFEIRKTLTKYSHIIEKQRRFIYTLRQDVLFEKSPLYLFASDAKERYIQLSGILSQNALKKAEKQISLHFINKEWMEYLDYISYIRESIHLVNIGSKTPLDEFHKIAINAFENLLNDIRSDIVNALNSIEITEDGVDLEKEGFKAPSSTWTYLINDKLERFEKLNLLKNPAVVFFFSPAILGYMICKIFFRKKKK